MGSPLSPIIANMVMEKLEERANNSFHSPPCIWFRYVDDVYGIMESNYIEEFHQYLNTICDSIKFTREEEYEGALAFLDVLVTRTPEGSLQTTVFRKPTHTGRYLPFSSHHPLQQKLSIPRTLFSRAENIVKDDELKKDEIRIRSITPWLQMDIQDFIANDGLLALKANPNKRKSWLWFPMCRISPSLLSVFCSKLVWGWLWSLFVFCLIFFVSPKTKFLTKKSRALFNKYLVVTAMRCTSVKQAEA